MQMFSTKKLSQLLSYPFQDNDATKKFLIGSLLALGSFLIVPIFFLLGYFSKIAKRISAGDGQLVLPEWENWGDLFKEGARVLGVLFIYNLPGTIVITFGSVFYFVSAIAMPIYGENAGMIILLFIAMFVLFFSMGFGFLLFLIQGLFSPVAMMHTIHTEKFKTGFELKTIWKTFKNNWGGFLVSFIFIFGLTYLLYFIVMVTAYTFVLAAVTPFIQAVGTFYLGLIVYPLVAQAYHEGSDKLETKEEEL